MAVSYLEAQITPYSVIMYDLDIMSVENQAKNQIEASKAEEPERKK